MGRIEFDYSKLRGRIREKFGSYKNLDPHISFSTVSLSNKLNNKTYFNNSEMIELAKALEIEDEELSVYFLSLTVRKDKHTHSRKTY